MGISKITRNYQITLPKDVRELKHLEEGDTVLFAIDGNRVDIVKMNKDLITSSAGLWSDLKESGVSYTKKMRTSWRKRLSAKDALARH